MSVTEFLSNFYPDINESIWLRIFDAKGIPERLKGYPINIETSRHQLKTDTSLQSRLKKINQTQGIYFVVNSGGPADADITRINAVFCEIDDKPILEQHDTFDNQSPWSPSMRVETKKSVHAYWLPSNDLTAANFLELQQGLILFYKSDKSIKNLSRVMRLPYFNHVSFGEDGAYKYQPVKIHTYRPDWIYSLSELREGFPLAAKAAVKRQRIDSTDYNVNTLEGVQSELRNRIMATKNYCVQGVWGVTDGVCHGGESKTGLRVNLASGAVKCWNECSYDDILRAFGLEKPEKKPRSKWEYVPHKEQFSDLYLWLQERKKEKG